MDEKDYEKIRELEFGQIQLYQSGTGSLEITPPIGGSDSHLLINYYGFYVHGIYTVHLIAQLNLKK